MTPYRSTGAADRYGRSEFHPQSEAGNFPSQIRLLPLPPYCPELNSIMDAIRKIQQETGK